MFDTLSETGALRLRDQITAYWRRRGYVVNARVELVSNFDRNGAAWAVRSDMVNGWPVGARSDA